ncbi:MAG: hypothetical protein ACREH8_01245 [Opitutaceae bacterium]
MTQPARKPSPHTDATEVFILFTERRHYLSITLPSVGRELVYAFTTLAKAEEFIGVMGEIPGFPEVGGLLPCTLGEWFEWQPLHTLPDLTIDLDPHTLRRHPFLVAADTSKFDVHSVTQHLPEAILHRVTITPRDSAAI